MIKNMQEQDKMRVAQRRIQGKERGLGYWAAVDYYKRITGEDLGDYAKPQAEQQLKKVG